jgi:hypothetical protein
VLIPVICRRISRTRSPARRPFAFPAERPCPQANVVFNDVAFFPPSISGRGPRSGKRDFAPTVPGGLRRQLGRPGLVKDGQAGLSTWGRTCWGWWGAMGACGKRYPFCGTTAS